MRAFSRLAVPILLLACSIPATAATFVLWQGEAIVTAASVPCFAGTIERANIRTGTVLKSLVRPRLLASNGNDSRVAFVHDSHSEFALDLAGGLTITGTGSYAAFGVTPSGTFKTDVGGTYLAFSLIPAAPTSANAFLTLSGTVNNFMFITGCTVSFRAGYSLRP